MEEEFLQDLAQVLEEEEDLQKEYKATKISVKTAKTLTRILPALLLSHLSRWAGALLSKAGGSSRVPQAALYGMSASAKNRKNVRKLVTDLLDGMY